VGRSGSTQWRLGLGWLVVAGACSAYGERAAAQATNAASGGQLAPANPTPAAPPPSGPSVEHVVKEGETLWDIARAYGVHVDDVLAASGMTRADAKRLSKGKKLRIPGVTQVVDVQASKAQAAQLPKLKNAAYHYLQRGESLSSLSATYDVPIEALMERNKLSDDDLPFLRMGRPLIIPGVRPDQIKHGKPMRDHFVHEIAKGETVWDLAHTFRVSVSELMAANGLSAEEVTKIRDGTRLIIPGVEDDGRGHVKRRASAREHRANAAARRLGLGTIEAAGKLLYGHVDERWIHAADKLGRFPGTLRWPVHNGAFVRGYGSGQGGYHKAMDIMGKIGWNVRAAAPGIVGYSGDEVSGFGNLVMLIHPGGWVTLYAHNSVNFVAAGESVPRGAVLAEVGSTGRSQGPHVHFELIYGGNNCDPAPLFRPGVRHRDGQLEHLAQASWSRADRQPKQVRCAHRQKHPPAQSVMNENPEVDATPEGAPTAEPDSSSTTTP
jgi:murein DD-endopeptidase MepM/ murein hydrolase activator NlpD